VGAVRPAIQEGGTSQERPQLVNPNSRLYNEPFTIDRPREFPGADSAWQMIIPPVPAPTTQATKPRRAPGFQCSTWQLNTPAYLSCAGTSMTGGASAQAVGSSTCA